MEYKRKKEMFYLMMHSTHFIFGYMDEISNASTRYSREYFVHYHVAICYIKYGEFHTTGKYLLLVK